MSLFPFASLSLPENGYVQYKSYFFLPCISYSCRHFTMDTMVFCKQCFFNNRSSIDHRCSHQTDDKVYIKWNMRRDMWLTTERSIRTNLHIPAHVNSIGYCNPMNFPCGGDKCTYAHGAEERQYWNDKLQCKRKRPADSSQPVLPKAKRIRVDASHLPGPSHTSHRSVLTSQRLVIFDGLYVRIVEEAIY